MTSIRKTISLILIIVAAGSFSLSVVAQSEVKETPIERIQKGSNGRIEIDIPEAVLQLIIQNQEQKKSTTEPTTPKTSMGRHAGYRIQVFSDGRNMRSIEAMAKARGSAIVSKLPKYRGQVYTFSKSPNWYTRVGNFRSQEEANSALAELRRVFPQYASEMRIVKSQIVSNK